MTRKPRCISRARATQAQVGSSYLREECLPARLPVHEVDERWSTTEALADGARDADAAAAAILLEQYFREHA